MINIALIGFGSIGLKYFKLLKKNKNFNIIKVLRKKNYINKKSSFVKFYSNKNKFFLKNKKDIHAYIVASPINTHYQYIKKILAKRKPLIIEKPIVKNVNELNKIVRLSSNINCPVLVNHSDLYSPAFQKLKKDIKLIGKYKKIKITFGKFQKIYKIYKKPDILFPYFDWLPHPLAISIKLAGYPKKIKILSKKINIKKKIIFQKLHIKLFCKQKIIDIFFSNNYKFPKRRIEIHGDKGSINYDLYKKKSLILKIKNKKKISYSFQNMSPLENLLKIFYNAIKDKKRISNINLSIKVMKIIFFIQKKINIEIS
jgi:predicted dehydrogenase